MPPGFAFSERRSDAGRFLDVMASHRTEIRRIIPIPPLAKTGLSVEEGRAARETTDVKDGFHVPIHLRIVGFQIESRMNTSCKSGVDAMSDEKLQKRNNWQNDSSHDPGCWVR